MADVKTVEVTIASGQSATQAFQFEEYHTISMWLPAAWTAAALTMQASLNGPTPTQESDWRAVYTDLSELILPADANRVISVAAGVLVPAGAKWLRLVSGTFAARVNQGAARPITATFRRF